MNIRLILDSILVLLKRCTVLRFITRHKTLIIYLAAYFFAISITLRYVLVYQNDASLLKVIGLLAAFLILLIIQTLLRNRSHLYTHFILAIQIGILLGLSLLAPHLDFYSTLSVTLALQAVYTFSGKIAFRWIGALALIVAVLLLYGQGWSRGLPLVVSNTAAVFISSALIVLAGACRPYGSWPPRIRPLTMSATSQTGAGPLGRATAAALAGSAAAVGSDVGRTNSPTVAVIEVKARTTDMGADASRARSRRGL